MEIIVIVLMLSKSEIVFLILSNQMLRFYRKKRQEHGRS